MEYFLMACVPFRLLIMFLSQSTAISYLLDNFQERSGTSPPMCIHSLDLVIMFHFLEVFLAHLNTSTSRIKLTFPLFLPKENIANAFLEETTKNKICL